MDNLEYLKKYAGGALIPEQQDTRNYKYGMIAGAKVNEVKDYPESFKLWTSGIKNQQDKSTCVAHMTQDCQQKLVHYGIMDIDLKSIIMEKECLRSSVWR